MNYSITIGGNTTCSISKKERKNCRLHSITHVLLSNMSVLVWRHPSVTLWIMIWDESVLYDPSGQVNHTTILLFFYFLFIILVMYFCTHINIGCVIGERWISLNELHWSPREGQKHMVVGLSWKWLMLWNCSVAVEIRHKARETFLQLYKLQQPRGP